MRADFEKSTRAPLASLRARLAMAIAILAGFGAVAAAGCFSAAQSTTITLTYTQPPFLNPAERAEGVGVKIFVVDQRVDKSKVGDLVGSSGTAEAPIVSSNSVTGVVHAAVRKGLETRGFNVGTGPVVMRIGIARLTTLYKSGVFGSASDTSVELDVQVVSAKGKMVFQRDYTGQPAGMQMSSGRGAAEALDDALDQAITTMLTDSNLMDALRAADARPPAASPAPS